MATGAQAKAWAPVLAAFAGGEPMAARRRKRLGGFLVYLLCGSVQRRLGALRPGTDQAPQG
ncbi:conserved hypothetical protein [Mycobacterium tuberculosis CPHL_A]|nr:conserved hypothetical protein [Mycobacterium tuberculosis CPHL_A]